MAKTPFYKRTKPGALNTTERNLVAEIESICEQNGVDLESLDVANSIEELQDLKAAIKMQHGSSSKPSPKASENSSTEKPVEEAPVEKAPVEKAPVEKAPVDSEFEKTNQSIDFSDFVPQDNSNPFAVEVKTENREYASGQVNVGGEEALDVNSGEATTDAPSRQPSVDDVSSVEEAPASDSVSSPWDVNTDNEVEVKNRDAEIDELAKSDDPEKVKLAETTKKKATKHICKQAANLYAIVVEKTGKWAGQISDKKLAKMEESGEIDRYFVLDENTGQTVEKFVDDHNNSLEKMVKLDEDVKDDFQEALELVMEKHQWEVTPEVNLAIVAISGIATVVKQGRDCRKESMKVLEQTSKNFKLLTHQMIQKDSEINELKKKMAEMENHNRGVEQPSNVIPLNEANEDEVEEIKKGAWIKKEDELLDPSPRRNTESLDQDNLIEGSPPLDEERPKFASRKQPSKKPPVKKKSEAKK